MAARIPQIDAGNGVGPLGCEPRKAAERGRLNPKMFNSFLDGSKPAIESSAIANATGLLVPTNGLQFPVGGAEDLANIMRPVSEGGALEQKGMVEVASALTRKASRCPMM
jgi:predicted homoserine dehydrogenase-like protein